MKTLLNIKTDVAVKREAKKFAEAIGFPLSTLINASLKQMIREQSVNFAVPLRPNRKTARLIKKADEDFKKGIHISPVFDNAEDAIAYLHQPL
ncbi:MAG: hypothetical protein A3J10_04255 [Candidatus Sungbacteria bacterium RIFCSPLOWO2_02_FULL_54_10]|uniref:Damage-inducible protein J n=2 Tax=Candidatus Sungiibacteriota TaxID=1817917 RepID=A0A1G2L7L6_9BACT|nr:MAG: hypothetical protein A3C92_00125 [Candidatus Sungbacteria bacterium RIFCSPHIGHO2_02_FULL_53_17]OHA06822.1 MAG: hypothetical protein A3B34_02640 [Candidatus Sungbacteria bacterium RIFCSPLOWO2_01_FULL_54_21]OHA13082.1 MAG: hypothetical protein A3J10_04255 [Candidatus Sungbacteria bacterium RIFCSPLOWO2_02_FULL_54_10]